MCGSSGSSWNDEPITDCARLSQQTPLNSPNSVILSQLSKGDLLEVHLNKLGKAVVVEALHLGQVAGTITSSILQTIAECIEKGYEYVAEVIEVREGSCRVHVRPK
jgi:hypothetical protein